MSKTKTRRGKHKKKDEKKHKIRNSHKEKKSKKQKIDKIKMKVETNVVSEDANLPKSKIEASSYDIPIDLMFTQSHAPETPAEFQKRQAKIRRITDPETGRSRLIKGDGEVLEEIVSRERHNQINKLATANDGRFFQEQTSGRNK